MSPGTELIRPIICSNISIVMTPSRTNRDSPAERSEYGRFAERPNGTVMDRPALGSAHDRRARCVDGMSAGSLESDALTGADGDTRHRVLGYDDRNAGHFTE